MLKALQYQGCTAFARNKAVSGPVKGTRGLFWSKAMAEGVRPCIAQQAPQGQSGIAAGNEQTVCCSVPYPEPCLAQG